MLVKIQVQVVSNQKMVFNDKADEVSGFLCNVYEEWKKLSQERITIINFV